MRKGCAPHRIGPTPGRIFAVASLSFVLAFLRLSPARGQTPAPARAAPTSRVPGAIPPPANDPRKGPRLLYNQGPPECVDEEGFRDEVAIATDGIDHLASDGAASVRVWFEKDGATYRGFVLYTDANGVPDDPPIVTTDPYCPMLARWVAGTVSLYVPPAPKPPVTGEDPSALPSAGPVFVPPRVMQSLSLGPPVRPSSPFSLSEIWKRMDLTIGISAYALMTAGFTANVGPGIGIGFDVRGQVFSFGVEARGIFPAVAYARDPDDPTKPATAPAKFDLSEVTGLLVPCLRYSYLVGCGVAKVGVLLAQDNLSSTTDLALAFGPRVGLDFPIGDHVALFGFAELLVNVTRITVAYVLPSPGDTFVPNVQWREALASPFFAAGISFRFK